MTSEQNAQANTQGNGQATAAKNLPLFYRNPMPLDAEKHGNLGLVKNFNLSFTRTINAVPINMIEMPQICHHYPIAFSPDNNAAPVAILGMRDGENLFVDENGNWQPDTYIPAYIRRYPFIFSEMPDSDQLTLCVDLDNKIVSEDGEQKFFDEEGKPSQLSQNALEFCKAYHAAAQQTQSFSKVVQEYDLLVDRQAEITVQGNKKISFSGFKIIDEEKLSKLDDDKFLEWRRKGWLPFLYAHLFSGSQWQRLTSLLNARMANEG